MTTKLRIVAATVATGLTTVLYCAAAPPAAAQERTSRAVEIVTEMYRDRDSVHQTHGNKVATLRDALAQARPEYANAESPGEAERHRLDMLVVETELNALQRSIVHENINITERVIERLRDLINSDPDARSESPRT